MVHVINEVPRSDLSNILLTKPFEQSPIGVLKTPPNGFEITDIPIAFLDHVCVFGQTFDRKMVEGELSFDCSLCIEQTQCIVFGNFARADNPLETLRTRMNGIQEVGGSTPPSSTK